MTRSEVNLHAPEAEAITPLPEPARAREIRERADVSRESVARAIGVSLSSVVRWESGVSRPRGDVRRRYVDLLAQLNELGKAA